LIRAEATNEESEEEEEEFGSQGPADFLPDEGRDVGLLVLVRRSAGLPHLTLSRDRLRFPRSPPENGFLPATHRVRAWIG